MEFTGFFVKNIVLVSTLTNLDVVFILAVYHTRRSPSSLPILAVGFSENYTASSVVVYRPQFESTSVKLMTGCTSRE